MYFCCCVFLAYKPGAGSSGEGMTVERHPVSILNEYGQKKGVKVTATSYINLFYLSFIP